MLVTAVTRAVQDALEADATERVRAGKPPLARSGQEALAYKVLSAELQRHDAERLGSGGARLTPEMEQSVVDRVLALSVGLGPVELLLADESVEEIVASRFDLVFVYRSDGSVEHLDERLMASEQELKRGFRILLVLLDGRNVSSTTRCRCS